MSWIDNNGYIRTGKHRLMHRILMEEHIGRKLLREEKVHHKNGDILDNRVSNLEILSSSEHMTLHRRKKHRQHHDIEWLKKQLEYGKKVTHIAKKCGVSQVAVYNFIKRHIKGVPYKTFKKTYFRAYNKGV